MLLAWLSVVGEQVEPVRPYTPWDTDNSDWPDLEPALAYDIEPVIALGLYPAIACFGSLPSSEIG